MEVGEGTEREGRGEWKGEGILNGLKYTQSNTRQDLPHSQSDQNSPSPSRGTRAPTNPADTAGDSTSGI